ncbi:HK97 gp10 family phage protein [Micromonospora sp. CA-246542]|uniref:HK97 gp10 family phage protein n=1 Tax=Micromonospora sp. CA-246542 TaxID=3239959 RepID=UPI003D8C8A05
MDMKVGIEGLSEFNRGLRKLDKEAPKGLRLALNDVAGLLVTKTQPRIPKRTGNAAASLKARSTRTSARVAVGGRKAPYYPWLDFGGKTGRKRSVDRPFYKEGRYLYPTLREIRPQIETALQEALTDVARSAGLDVD